MANTPDPDSTSFADTLPLPDGPPDSGPPARADIGDMLAQLGVTPPSTLEPPPASVTQASPPRRLGRYQLGAALGRGGMGVVVEALDTELRRPVAVKTLKDPDGAGRGQLARFVAEARITGQLDHPNIVPVHDLGISADGELFFVMKRVGGQSLKSILAELRAGEPEALAAWPPHRLMNAFLDVCQAVAYAHGRGVIHRDLKPDNIMLGAYGEVVVMDWGIARVLNGEPEPVDREAGAGEVAVSRTADGAIIGTPGWMSPEQARGWLDRVDRTSDVWSLGAILYLLLTFRPPYEETNPMRLLYAAAKGPPEDPRVRAPEFDIDPGLADLCLRALSTDQAGRPADAGIFAQEVEAHLAGVAAQRETTATVRRGGALALAAALLLGGAFFLTHEASERADDATLLATALSVELEHQALVSDALREEVAGRHAAAAALHRAARSVAAGDGDLRRLLGPAALRRALPSERPARQLVWVGDETVAVAYADGGVTLWSVASGGAQHLPDARDVQRLVILEDGALGGCVADGRGPVWTGTDGVYVGRRDLGAACTAPIRSQGASAAGWGAAALAGGRIRLLPQEGTPITLGPGAEVVSLGFAPDAGHLAAARADGAVDVWTVGHPLSLIGGVGADGLDAYVGARNNLRVCRADGRVVAVVPFPAVDSVWADAGRCATR